MGAHSPGEYGAHMLQQFAPPQTGAHVDNYGMSSNLMQQNNTQQSNMFNNLNALNRTTNIADMNSNEMMSTPNSPGLSMLQSGPSSPSVNNLANLQMLGGGRSLKIPFIYK